MDDTALPHFPLGRYQPRSQQSANYAFLNHSSATLPNNLPPAVDDKPLARQKRRRTRYALRSVVFCISADIPHSPEDQAILEAAYLRDFKPDKAARLELVKQVGLGEKEVQVCLGFVSLSQSRPRAEEFPDLVPESKTDLSSEVEATSSS